VATFIRTHRLAIKGQFFLNALK